MGCSHSPPVPQQRGVGGMRCPLAWQGHPRPHAVRDAGVVPSPSGTQPCPHPHTSPPAPPAPQGARAPPGQPSTHPGCQHRADTGQAAAWGRGAGSCWPPAALLPPSTACCRFYGAARWDAPGGGPRCPAQPQPPRTQGPEASPAPCPPQPHSATLGQSHPCPPRADFGGCRAHMGQPPPAISLPPPGPRMKPGPPAGAAPLPASLHRGAGPQPGRAWLCWRRQIVPRGGPQEDTPHPTW